MKMISDFIGAGDIQKVVAKNIDGQKIDPMTTCFPILEEVSAGQFKILGTGFFVLNFGVFLTAKHVFEDVINFQTGEQLRPIVIMHAVGNGEYLVRSVSQVVINNTSDIALCLASNVDKNNNKIKNKVIEISFDTPSIGSKIFTYAYPESTHSLDSINLVDGVYPGRITDFHPIKRDSALLRWPVFETDMYIYGGASGGPVFNNGVAFAVNTSSLQNEKGVLPCSYVTPIREAAGLYVPGLNNLDGSKIILADAVNFKFKPVM